MQNKPHILFLLLGSNLGDKKKQLNKAQDLIREMIGPVTRHSSIYETEPCGFSSENTFLNRALKVSTFFSPEKVMMNIHEIEKTFGRERNQEPYSSRTMDIDILFYDDLILISDTLKIPHPRLHDRKFVLVPLNEIAPRLIHPISGKTIKELLADCKDTKKVWKFFQPKK
jgi:2-amino-4-hydroxy-6-hydroxymethyldihydropteridine diphosphokinase